MTQLSISISLFGILLFLTTIIKGIPYYEDLTITLDEKKIMDQFIELVRDRLPHDYMKEESYIIRWLRFGYFNIRDSEKALMDYIQWRKENNIDTILQEDWSDFDKEYKYYLESRDNEGKPVLYISAHNWDIRKAVLSGNRDRFHRYFDKSLEEACSLVRELGDKYRNVSQGILIINVDGFNLVQHGCLQCISTILRVVVQIQAHHPGCADKIFLLNMPQIAEPILRAARPLLHPDTNKSLQVYGTNKKQWQDVLRNYFEMEELPQELGGTKIYKGSDDDDY